MKKLDFIQLSKTVAHALRHEPQFYSLKLDSEGWVVLSDLVSALNTKGIIVADDAIMQMIEQSEKKRYQILDGRIRAYYGHSTDEKVIKHHSSPPDILYHGTITRSLNKILEKGILPMGRQYVHLSIDEETAKLVASRRQGELIIIKVKAQEAYKNNIKFYKEENGIWLAEPISSKFIYV